MVKETLPTWPEKQENPWLRSIKDIFETLKKSRQESKAEKKNEVENINTQLIDHFSEDYGKFFQQKSFCTSLDIEEKLRKTQLDFKYIKEDENRNFFLWWFI